MIKGASKTRTAWLVLLAPLLGLLSGPGIAAQDRTAAPASRPRTDLYGDPLPDGAIARFGTVRLRHSPYINAVAFSPDGRTLASAGRGKAIFIWDAETGKRLGALRGAKGSGMSIAFSPDGKKLLSGSNRGGRLWDLETGKEILVLSRNRERRCVRMSPGGERLATAGTGGISIWDVAAGTRVHRLRGHKDNWVISIAFSPDGKTLASGSSDKAIVFWDVAEGKERRRIDDVGMKILSIAYSPDGIRLAAAGSSPGRCSILDVATGKAILSISGHEASVWAVVYSPDGASVATASKDGTVRVWEAASGEEQRSFRFSGRPSYQIAFSPDGKKLAWGSGVGVRIQDLSTDQPTPDPLGHQGAVNTLALSGDGRMLATASLDRSVRLWDAGTGKEIRRLEGHGKKVEHLAFTPDGRYLASAGRGEAVRIWESATGKQHIRLEGDPARIRCLAFSPDGELLATGGDDEIVRLWESRSGREVLKTERLPVDPIGVAFDPRGKWLVTQPHSSSPPSLYDVSTGERMGTFDCSPSHARAVLFSHDGRLLITAGREVHVIETASGQAIRDTDLGSSVRSIAISPDGKTLAVGYLDGNLDLVDMSRRFESRRLSDQQDTATSLAFSSDGTKLASGHQDGTALLWEIPSDSIPPESSGRDLEDDALEEVWAHLGGSDAAEAHAAIETLAAGGAAAVRFLRDRLEPAEADYPDRLRQLIADLDHEEWDTRERASAELEKLGGGIERMIRDALEDARSPEQRVRLEALIEKIGSTFFLPPGDALREARVIEILERIGSPDAVSRLEGLSRAALRERILDEAREALDRIGNLNRE